MGYSVHTYLGPMLRIPTVVVTTTPETKQCTRDATHRVKASDAFCSTCGAAVGLVKGAPVDSVTLPSPLQLPTAFENDAYMPESVLYSAKQDGYVVWLPNQRGHGLRFDEDNLGFSNLPDETSAVEKYQKRYAPLIQAVRDHFGVEPTVVYGIFAYTH